MAVGRNAADRRRAARLRRDPAGRAARAAAAKQVAEAAAPADARGSAPARYVRTLARLAIVLIPEYLVLVFAVGALRGWLFPLDGGVLDVAVLGAIVAAVAGTLVVIPTGGEIPILTGLAAAGVGAGSSARC